MEYLIIFRIYNMEWIRNHHVENDGIFEYVKYGFDVRRKAEEFIEKFNESMKKEKDRYTGENKFKIESIILHYYRCDIDEIKLYFKDKELPENLYKDIM